MRTLRQVALTVLLTLVLAACGDTGGATNNVQGGSNRAPAPGGR